MSSWENFAYDDDDELLERRVDEGFTAADENDDPSVKAAAGMALEPPEVSFYMSCLGEPVASWTVSKSFVTMHSNPTGGLRRADRSSAAR